MLAISEGQSLYLVISLLYLSDCFIWLGKGSVTCIGGLFGKWTPRFAHSYLGTESGGIVRLNIFPPAGRSFSAHLIPASISPSSVVSYNPQTIKVMSPSNGVVREYLIEQIDKIRWDGQEVFINGESFCKFGHHVQAKNFVSLVRDLKQVIVEKREALIRKFWAEQFNLEKAKQIYSQFGQQTKWLVVLSNTLFIILFIASPLIKLLFGLNLAIIFVASFMFLFAIIIACLYFRYHRSYFPEQKGDRILETIKMIICPPIAIRSADQFSVNLLAGFNPYLIARLLLSTEDFASLINEAFRCLKHPFRDGSLEKSAQDTIDWHNRIMLSVTETFLKTINYDFTQCMLTPAPQDLNCVAYCPRCLAQSYNAGGECPECFGVKKISLNN